MELQCSPGTPELILPTDASGVAEVILADGTARHIGNLGTDQLVALQWEQEKAFANRILTAPKRSAERELVTARAYDTVTKILAAQLGNSAGPLTMGLHPRHQQLVLQLLARQQRRGLTPAFFEIGYGSGALLRGVCDRGFPAAGIEVSAEMHRQAARLLGADRRVSLYLGDFLSHELAGPQTGFSLIYWNDVFEHVPPDEIGDYLRKIHHLLVPGGRLVTVTPNWHLRPSDVTGAFHPPRTAAAGLHLKEYTLRQVSHLLRQAGFHRIATPLIVTPRRIVLAAGGLARLKRLVEPSLEHLPLALTRLLCRGFALNCTIATKADR